MARENETGEPDLLADPFAERSPLPGRTVHVLGSRFRFESNSERFLELVDDAYAGLPRQRLPGPNPDFKVRLLSLGPTRRGSRAEPPPLAMVSGAGYLGGASPTCDAVVMSPRQRSALVLASERMLRSPYHARYELIEFAVFTLASRCRDLVPLHGACVGRNGRGILLMGSSGAGKSTVTLLSLTAGLDIMAEDSVFATQDGRLATGVPNYLHVRADSLRWLGSKRDIGIIRDSPVIRRRSGVRKFEVDLRRGGYGLARSAFKIAAVVFLSARRSRSSPHAVPLSSQELRARLVAAQAYAAGQPGWSRFSRGLAKAGGYEIERGRHPLDTVRVLEELLSRGAPSRG